VRESDLAVKGCRRPIQALKQSEVGIVIKSICVETPNFRLESHGFSFISVFH